MNILITGGASGLGAAITKDLARDKENTVLFTYSNSSAKAHELEKLHTNTKAIKCNFMDADEINVLLQKIDDGDLDVLINNAYSGDFLKSHFHKIDANDFLNDFQNNIIPTVQITQRAIKKFRKKKSGKIITILTAALLDVPPIGASIYCANKAYMEKLTKVWASENGKFGITSNSVSPAFMQTEMTAGFDERIVEQMVSSHPLKKILTTEEVAESVSYLVNASNQINGIDIVMNAGSSLR